jgi:hypothetical protein
MNEMKLNRERFEQGLTYEEYKDQMTRNHERFEENERTVRLDPGDVAFFSNLEPLNVLVIAEDWCGDVIANVPVLGRLAAESGTLNVRVFLRDQNLDIMENYLNEGQFRSIPTFVFFDEEFNEIGHWIERPALATQKKKEMLDELFATDPLLKEYARDTSPALLSDEARERQRQASEQFRTEFRETSDREVVREIRALLEGAPAYSASVGD